MSSAAIAVHDLGARLDRPAGRRHLRLVGPHERPVIQPGVDRDCLRITRRGRLVLTAAASSVVAVLVAASLALVLPAGATGVQQYVVQPGQTLSQIAATELPQLPLDRAVVSIQQANQLSSPHVQAGQRLDIPKR